MEDIMKKAYDEETVTKMSELLFIAADETRLKILLALIDGKKNVSELINDVNCSQSLVSHQLQVLKKAKLVSFEKQGNFVFYSLDDNHIYNLIKVAYDHVSEK